MVLGAVGADWPQFRQDPWHSGSNDAESIISPGNVGQLELAWTSKTGQGLYASPAVADGVAYIGGDTSLNAFAVNCGSDGGECSPIWTGTTGQSIGSSPAVADGVVYVGSYDAKLYAFAVGCASGGRTCRPLWTGRTGAPISSSPVVAEGVVYIVSNRLVDREQQFYDSTLYAFAAGCASHGASCKPLWTGDAGTGALSESPAIADGVVYVAGYTGLSGTCLGGDCTPAKGKLYAFNVGCATDGRRCSPRWTATIAGLPASPSVVNGVLYVKSGRLEAFDTRCLAERHPCSPLWTGKTPGQEGSGGANVAVADGGVYAGDSAFRIGCASDGRRCDPLWRSRSRSSLRRRPLPMESSTWGPQAAASTPWTATAPRTAAPAAHCGRRLASAAIPTTAGVSGRHQASQTALYTSREVTGVCPLSR